MWSMVDWRAAHPDVPEIFDLEGVGFEAASCPDYMHSKHLGTDQNVYGSVLQMLTHCVQGSWMLSSADPEANMAELMGEI